ncbi:hypothetical protein H696_05715 [Fonticula alba]|uniref:type II protein arginine methyltransferase n=1 Tax=Fonticula alba TaxID=691883 RepID=A0A058Z2L5_FONAL|nr:hypothetical protein H696_05715 [Fonticula alba]KCV67772.1 hypothetical protein H696_05715 [Fonticula alba]|eukprot:XP_009497803.1 hypothetical protein H696_05715 [Fonticula alba]
MLAHVARRGAACLPRLGRPLVAAGVHALGPAGRPFSSDAGSGSAPPPTVGSGLSPAEQAGAPVSHDRFLQYLISKIRLQGPLSVADFMKECLTNPVAGFYMHHDALGRAGDFVTSPEVSSLFGDCVGTWVTNVLLGFEGQGAAGAGAGAGAGGSPFRLVELDPGKGTLMKDVLRVARRLYSGRGVSLGDRLSRVQLVEASPTLRAVQAAALQVDPATGRTPDGVAVSWYGSLEEIQAEDRELAAAGRPAERFVLLAHEFLDALPVFQFVRPPGGAWSEVLVSLSPRLVAELDPVGPAGGEAGSGPALPPMPELSGEDAEHDLCFTLSDGPTPNSSLVSMFAGPGGGAPATVTHAPASSSSAAAAATTTTTDPAPEDDRIEISAAVADVSARIAQMVEDHRGVALIVDYGVDGPLRSSVRGIRQHQFVHPLLQPGTVDLSADVDFSLVRRAAMHMPLAFDLDATTGSSVSGLDQSLRAQRAGEGQEDPAAAAAAAIASRLDAAAPLRRQVNVSGLMTQHEFLRDMGIGVRLQQVLKLDSARQAAAAKAAATGEALPPGAPAPMSREDRAALISGVRRLVDLDQMGQIYKFIAISPSDGSPEPGPDALPYPFRPHAPAGGKPRE